MVTAEEVLSSQIADAIDRVVVEQQGAGYGLLGFNTSGNGTLKIVCAHFLYFVVVRRKYSLTLFDSCVEFNSSTTYQSKCHEP